MFERITESLKKPFLKNPATETGLTVTSEEIFVEKPLGDKEVSFPNNHKISGGKLTEREKQTLEEQEEAYIRQYRLMETMPEISSAIDEIVNEAMNVSTNGTITPNLTLIENSSVKENTQKSLQEEWLNVMKLLDFADSGDDLFRRWYVDGKLICEVVYKDKENKNGIQQILQLTPFGFRKRVDTNDKLYYIYTTRKNAINISKLSQNDYYDPEQILLCKSGLKQNNIEIGYLFSAIKPSNNMGMIEDSFVIYRLLRAAETRVWNVNVGKMPKNTAETYLNKVINQVKSELSYNPSTGEFDGRSATPSLINDYVFPTRGGNEGTSVSTIGGDTSFVTSAEDHQLFLRKLYIAMKIPVSRLDADNSTMDFTSTDILRAEMKFTKFTNKLRRKFSQFLLDVLKLQMISKGLVTEAEWDRIKSELIVKWNAQNEIIENARITNLKTKAETVVEMESNGIIGKFISYETVMTDILGMTKEEFEEEKKKIELEKKDPHFYPPKPEGEE